MKKILSLFLAAVLALTLAACGSPAGPSGAGSDPAPDQGAPSAATPGTPPTDRPDDSAPPERESAAEPDGSGKKILIAYFSATHNTENIANHLNEILDADLYEIVPETPYTSEDLDYNTDCRANREQNDVSARPAVSGSVEDMEQYDVIFLGYPIWWGQAPKIMYTFLERYDLSGKTIVPFCTSGSSGVGSSAADLASSARAADWLSGSRFSGSDSQSVVADWVNGLDLTPAPQN